MNEQWLAALLLFGAIVLSIHLSWITWKWFFRWQSRQMQEAPRLQEKVNWMGAGLFRR